MGQYVKYSTGTVVNNDTREYQQYRLQRDRALRDHNFKERLTSLEMKIDFLSETVRNLINKEIH